MDMTNWGRVRFGLLFVNVLVGLALSMAIADEAVVGFDAPAMAIAVPVNPEVVNAPLTGGKLVRVKVPVSTFLSPAFQGAVNEYVVELHCPQQTMRVVDFWPKQELYSEVQGTVSVDNRYHKDSHFAFNVSGGYEPFVRGNANGEFNEKIDSHQQFNRKPPMQLLTSAGTVLRGYGVFFKFRPGPVPQLEGEREVAILFEVPTNWRADLIQVTMHAAGQNGSSRSQVLGQSRLWMTVHQEGDQAAAAQAQRYVTQERALRALAAASQKQIEEKSLPTIWHKVGAALEVVEPKIPSDYLTKILFGASPAAGSKQPYFDNATNRLPVNVRVAILDYWEQRDAVLKLASGTVGVRDLAAK